MKYDIQTKLYRVSILLEILVGLSIVTAIGAAIIGLVADIHIGNIVANPDLLQEYLKMAMSIIIGIEFVKMIFSHTIDSVVEVMLLAVARQMVLEHTSPFENLLAVISVALMFVIRKFLFVRQLDTMPHDSRSLLSSVLRRKDKNKSIDRKDDTHDAE